MSTQRNSQAGFRFDRFSAALLFVALLVHSVALAGTPMNAAKVKQVLARRGVGKGVRVTEADGTEITGMLLAMGDDQFEVWPKKGTQGVFIPYSSVSRIRGGSKAWLYTLIIPVATGVLVAVGTRN